MQSPPAHPRLVRRLASVLRGEVPAAELEVLRAAGRGVYQVYLKAEQLQVELAGAGTHPFLASTGQRTQLLCTWNAYVLQVLGEALIDGDYRASPITVGYLPPVTFEQAWACFVQVEPWLARCRRAADDPSYDLADDVELPVPLPAWIVVEDYPRNYLGALAHAAAEVGAHAAVALGAVLAAGRPPAGQAARLSAVQGMLATADSAVASVPPLLASSVGGEQLRELVARRLQDALEQYFEVGQRLCVDVPEPVRVEPTRPVMLPAPGEPGFDIWCLTAPEVAARLVADRQAQQELHRLWRFDPDPGQTLLLQAQLLAAVRTGKVRRALDDRGSPGSMHACPWSPVYEVTRSVQLGGRQLRPLTQFALEVSVGQFSVTGAFVRRVVTGPFSSTGRLRYRLTEQE